MLGWVFLSALQTFLSVWECDIRVNTCEKQHGVCEAVVFLFAVKKSCRHVCLKGFNGDELSTFSISLRNDCQSLASLLSLKLRKVFLT